MPDQISAPATLDAATLEAPECRMKSALETQSFCRYLINNDDKRSYKRSQLNGLIDGNPPFKASKLREAGRADACNVNWGRARSYMEAGSGQFYDLFAEAPNFMLVISDFGTTDQKKTNSTKISTIVDEILKDVTVSMDADGNVIHTGRWDYEMQLSQDQMTLHGTGPLFFEDSDCVLPKAVQSGDLKVPEFTKSENFYWDSCMIQMTYYPPELFKFIANEKAATAVGWNVEHTKKCIANATGVKNEAGILYEWEFYQAEMKNNALNYYDEAKIIRTCHVFWKEFSGRISHAIVERDSSSGNETKYLFIHVGKYASFQEAVHPMYFDRGNGGYHHSVTGLGVKMYAPMETENRMICSIVDRTNAPKMIFKPTSAEGTQRIQLARYHDYAVLPKGTEAVQNPINGYVEDMAGGLNVVQGINNETLATYKQRGSQKSGNPVTKFEKQMEAIQISALSKTQINRYYTQMDFLYTEIYRRLSNLNSKDPLAKKFQRKCEKEGVPPEAFVRVKMVQAARVAGQGTGFVRKLSIDSLIETIFPSLPEEGKINLIRDKIAVEAGQHAVDRYYPKTANAMASDQEVDALTEVAKLKVGVPSKPASSQNPVIFAATITQAAMQAIQSIAQNGEPHEVLRFLTLAGPAIAAHLQRFANDPTRSGVHKQLSQQLQKIARATDQLKKALAQQAQQQQKQAQAQQQAMNDAQLKQAKLKADIALKVQKQNAQLQQRAEKHRFDMAIEDSKTAHDLALNRIKAFSDE